MQKTENKHLQNVTAIRQSNFSVEANNKPISLFFCFFFKFLEIHR